MSIYELIREVVADFPLNSDDTIAIEVLNRLRVPKKAADVLLPLVENAVGQVRRSEVRSLERRAFARSWSRRQLIPDADATDLVVVRKQLLGESFVLEDGRRVTWAEATVDDHEARIAMLEKQRAGLAATVARHREAIDLIRSVGVSCLGEIEEAA